MAYLHNRISQKELKEQLYQESFKRITVSFYKYFTILSPQQFRDELFLALDKLKVFGRIYVAGEGINAQVSVPEFSFEEFQEVIALAVSSGREQLKVKSEKLNDDNQTKNKTQNSELSNRNPDPIRFNLAVNDNGKSFWVLKIKVREKIVADGITDPSFSMEKKGKYVDAVKFNALTNDADTIVVDMRNHYEFEVGHFKNALEIPSDTFREQLPMAVEMLQDKKEKNIIMYCTGGIRCEKASAYMLHHGFKNVYHLEGGIINYANTVKEKHLENKFLGKNFVFDDRLGEKIGDEIISKCHQCGKPADTHVNCINPGCHLLFIQCEACKIKYESCCSVECQTTIHLPEEEQKLLRKNIDKGRNIFNKSKVRREGLKEED